MGATLPTDLYKFTSKNYFVENIERAWHEARANLNKTAEYSKGKYDQKYKKTTYEVGDLVRVHMLATKKGLKFKLRGDIYKGPVPVIEVGEKGNVKLLINNKEKWVHCNRLKKAETEWEKVSKGPLAELPMAKSPPAKLPITKSSSSKKSDGRSASLAVSKYGRTLKNTKPFNYQSINSKSI
jgi:hypothetical protein